MKIASKSYMLVTLLLSTAALTGCVSQSDYDALQAQNERLEQQLTTQSAQLSAANVRINQLQGAIKYTVNSDLLFAPGSWQMSPRGQQIIGSFAQKLAPTQEHKLLVNGYTDNTPIGARLMHMGVTTNKELSQKRADSVMQFLISQGVKPELVSAHGYGDADPIGSNDTETGRGKNRRVELELAS